MPVEGSHASGYRKILSEEIKKLRLPATAYFNRRHAAQAAEAAPSAVRPDSRRVRADLEIRRLLLILRLLFGHDARRTATPIFTGKLRAEINRIEEILKRILQTFPGSVPLDDVRNLKGLSQPWPCLES
jgi:hypothetical protein